MNNAIDLLIAIISLAETKPIVTIIFVMIIGKAIFIYFVIKELKRELNRMADSFQDHIVDQKEVKKDVVNIKSNISEINGMLKVLLKYEKN